MQRVLSANLISAENGPNAGKNSRSVPSLEQPGQGLSETPTCKLYPIGGIFQLRKIPIRFQSMPQAIPDLDFQPMGPIEHRFGMRREFFEPWKMGGK